MATEGIQVSLHGRRLGLSATNKLIINDEQSGGSPFATFPSLSVARGTLTNAEILEIDDNAITIVAAPGAGFIILVHYAIFSMDYNGTGYTAGAGEDLVLGYTDHTGAVATNPIDGAAFAAATADVTAIAYGTQASDQGAVFAAASVNAALVAFIQSGPITGAGSDWVYNVYYERIPALLSAT